jgi:hypothetical protein
MGADDPRPRAGCHYDGDPCGAPSLGALAHLRAGSSILINMSENDLSSDWKQLIMVKSIKGTGFNANA